MKNYTEKGFTLIELMVVVAILAIIMAVAVPGLTSMSERGQMRAALDKLKTSLQSARSEAVARRAQVVLCAKQANGLVCQAGGQSATRLGDDWMMFVDRDNNGVYNRGSGQCGDNEDCLLATESFGSGQLTMTSAAGAVVFRPDGTPGQVAGYQILVCAGDAKANNDELRSVTLTVMPTGALSSRRGAATC